MTKIESKKVSVNASSEKVFQYLKNLDNLVDLLPAKNISDWTSQGTSCSFKVQGAYKISLVHQSDTPNSFICFASGEGSPFPFTLNIHIEEKGSTCDVHQICEAQINPFLEMIVKGPLKNLFDYIADKLAEKFNS
ncbi:MAG: hypothetical protein RL220_1813 [Bacteroidota bacterium]|jgi:carbon monoxide dehydrogenase subunit G